MSRKLAHVETIKNIQPIANSDFLELVTVLGWQVVVSKSENHSVGDKIIYVEIDSLLPPTEDFKFMEKYKYRVKTIKLRGQVSQGLILPVNRLEDSKFWARGIGFIGEDGDDVTEDLHIEKYLSKSERSEASEEARKIDLEKNRMKKFMYKYSWYRKLFLSRKQELGFPYWVSKTDEERIQNIPHVLDIYKDSLVYVTEKVDYQSVTFTGKKLPITSGFLGKHLPKKFKFVVCSRNLINNDPNSLYWKVARKYKIESILRNNPHLTIQGEQGDINVQGNKYHICEPKLWVFNIYDHEDGYYYDYNQMASFCKANHLETVPFLGWHRLGDIGATVKDIVAYSRGKSTLNQKIDREGIVVRYMKGGKKDLSFKVINPEFLLKNDE